MVRQFYFIFLLKHSKNQSVGYLRAHCRNQRTWIVFSSLWLLCTLGMLSAAGKLPICLSLNVQTTVIWSTHLVVRANHECGNKSHENEINEMQPHSNWPTLCCSWLSLMASPSLSLMFQLGSETCRMEPLHTWDHHYLFFTNVWKFHRIRNIWICRFLWFSTLDTARAEVIMIVCRRR